MPELKIRKFETTDTEELAKLFFDSVRHGTKAHYTSAQRRAWSPIIPETDVWRDRLISATTYVAEDSQGIAGFMTLAADGHIDLAYVRADAIGKGVARELYKTIEKTANNRGLKTLHTEASDLAKTFFTRQNWKLVETQKVERQGVFLSNHRMIKHLAP